MNVRMAGLACAVAAALAFPALAVGAPIAAVASTPTPTPTPGTIVDPRPAPTSTGVEGRTITTAPLGAHLPGLAPGQNVTSGTLPATGSAATHQLKIMSTGHQLKVMSVG